jgi:hypothetical protein
MVKRSTVFQAEDLIGPGLFELHPKAIDIAGHSLDLSQKGAFGSVNAEAVCHVFGRYPEFDEPAA